MEPKPCPICGDLPEVSLYREKIISLTCIWCGYHECDADVWNNCWAHHRIAELEDERCELLWFKEEYCRRTYPCPSCKGSGCSAPHGQACSTCDGVGYDEEEVEAILKREEQGGSDQT